MLERKVEVVARGPREQKTILARLAALYAQELARPPLARQTYERLLKIDPENTEALEYLTQPAPPPVEPAATTAPKRTGTTLPRPVPAAMPPAEAPPAETPAPAPTVTGDEAAQQQYWRSAGVESEPVLRANSLVAKARVSLSRAEIAAATDDLEQALVAAPQHPGALVLLAEIAYRKQDWPRARELYIALELAPNVAEVVPREQIVQRRAALAQRLGDTAEAEAFYRELAILNPRHVEARRVLAELALARGDTATAALRLEELLRLLPAAGASADVGELRHRLGAIYAETGEWNGARYYLELVVDQDPSRLPALELLLQTYQKLDLYHEAAEACGRLARLYPDRAHRAAVLYRQAELRRNELHDEPGALDAYLRSSDADPQFVPSRLRLIDHFWAEGDIDVVADSAGDLANVEALGRQRGRADGPAGHRRGGAAQRDARPLLAGRASRADSSRSAGAGAGRRSGGRARGRHD